MTKHRILDAYLTSIFSIFLHLSFSICNPEEDYKKTNETIETFCIIDAINTNLPLSSLFLVCHFQQLMPVSPVPCPSILQQSNDSHMEMTCARNTAKKH